MYNNLVQEYVEFCILKRFKSHYYVYKMVKFNLVVESGAREIQKKRPE